MRSSRTERALAISRDLNERRGQSIVLGNLASVLADRGDFAKATEYTSQQLKLARDLGSKNEQGLALKNLGDLHVLAATSHQPSVATRRRWSSSEKLAPGRARVRPCSHWPTCG